MRFLIAALIYFSLVNPAKGQEPVPGEYVMKETYNDTSQHTINLKLNCNGTFIRSDLTLITYGKWAIKKDKLSLSIDSITQSNITSPFKANVKYELRGNRIYRISIKKKEYIDMETDARRLFPTSVGEGFKKYKAREESMYYEKVNSFICH